MSNANAADIKGKCQDAELTKAQFNECIVGQFLTK